MSSDALSIVICSDGLVSGEKSMSTLSSQPLSLLHINFDELYARPLCRHSQFGINVVHLAALFGTWYGVYGLVYALWPAEWVPAILAGTYVAVVAFQVPSRVAVATAVFMAF